MTAIRYAQSDAFILEVLGQRLKAARLERDASQEYLASVLGVSIPTYIAAEAGKMKLALLVAAMRHLNLLENLNLLLPEETLSPILQVKLHGKTRQRASSQNSLRKPSGLKFYPKTGHKTPLMIKNVGGVQERFARYTLADTGSAGATRISGESDSAHKSITDKNDQEW